MEKLLYGIELIYFVLNTKILRIRHVIIMNNKKKP